MGRAGGREEAETQREHLVAGTSVVWLRALSLPCAGAWVLANPGLALLVGYGHLGCLLPSLLCGCHGGHSLLRPWISHLDLLFPSALWNTLCSEHPPAWFPLSPALPSPRDSRLECISGRSECHVERQLCDHADLSLNSSSATFLSWGPLNPLEPQLFPRSSHKTRGPASEVTDVLCVWEAIQPSLSIRRPAQ